MKRLFGIAILAIVMGCNQSEKKAGSSPDSIQTDTLDLVNSVVIKDQQFEKVFTNYIILKNELVKSDSTSAKTAATALHETLVALNNQEAISKIAKEIVDAPTLALQRKNFTNLSTDLITLFKKVGVSSGTLYVQHCPMANKGDGGDWLSTEAAIKNPYYGDEMLACGRVVEKINK